ncbi:hypothetical protein LWE61_08025 [Sphingobium sufflavum]|nr:hypothetical protein [Sphingobium sufflavum]MCE7796508.1 hypothetical protein [Sphingobium sufflavum]
MRQFLLALDALLVGEVDHVGKKRLQPLGREQLLFDSVQHEVVQHLPPHARGGASLSLIHAVGADIIAVSPTLSGADRHGASATRRPALRDAGQHRGAGDDMGRVAARIARRPQRVDTVEPGLIDNGRAWYCDPVFGIRHIAIIVHGLVIIDPGIGDAAQDSGEIPVGELGSAQRRAARIERIDDPASATPHVCPVKNLVDHRGLCGDHAELHPLLLTVLVRDISLITKGHRTAIVEALARILPSALGGEDGCLDSTLFGDESREGLSEAFDASLAKILGDGDDFDTLVGKTIQRIEEDAHITRHARKTVE